MLLRFGSTANRRRTAMAADDQPDVYGDMFTQLRRALEQFNVIAARVPGVAQATSHLPGLPTIPTPGRLTAAQVSAVMGAVRAQRSTMQALRSSLDAFDQQLEILERVLEPVESMSETWAQIERRFSGDRESFGERRPPEARRSGGGPAHLIARWDGVQADAFLASSKVPPVRRAPNRARSARAGSFAASASARTSSRPRSCSGRNAAATRA